MASNTLNVAELYKTVADVLPTEGRDFTLDEVTAQTGGTTVLITPVSQIGRAWVPFLRDALTKTLANDGTHVEIAGHTQQEPVTLADLRQAAIAMTDQVLKLRVEATKRDVAEKRDRLVTLQNKTPPAPDAELAAARKAVSEAVHVASKVAKLPSKVIPVRKAIDAAAVQEATADEAVDPNERLTSLFDRYDMADRLKYKEEQVVKIAQHEVDIDELRAEATDSIRPIARDR